MNGLERFWDKVDKTETCWNWKASLSQGGYGSFTYGGKSVFAHRLSYELFKGQIPNGLEVDHLCRNRKCCNPDHLEAVTSKVNKMRSVRWIKPKTHCIKGHEYNEINTYFYGKEKHCRKCNNLAEKKSRLNL